MIARNPITILKAHFDGKRIVLDEPPPPDLEADTPLEVVYRRQDASHSGEDELGETVLDKIAKLAVDNDDLPPDYSEQFEHYRRGAPRR